MNRNTPLAIFVAALFLVPIAISSQTIDLPSSKQLIGEIPGHPAAAEQPANFHGRLSRSVAMW